MTSTVTLHLNGEEPRELPLPELEVSDRAASLARFAQAAERGQEPETSARDNIKSLAILLGCVESIETGDVVPLPSSFMEMSSSGS
jgi:predicted dehydrogenase